MVNQLEPSYPSFLVYIKQMFNAEFWVNLG